MRRTFVTVLALAALAVPAAAQDALPKFLKIEHAPDVELRYVDFGWNPEAFAAMETGGDHPAARRSWMLALLRVQRAMRFGGKPVLIGASLLILNPERGDTTINIMPARFETVPETKERLEITAVPSGNDTLITVHYGNRKTTITLTGI
jgi:hypothetical protein